MQYYNTITKQITNSNYLIDDGFDINNTEILSFYNWYPVEIDDIPRFNLYTQYVTLKQPNIVNGKWIRQWDVQFLSKEQQDVSLAHLRSEVIEIIDAVVSENIIKGFKHTVSTNNENHTYWFNYQYDDQRNFTDTAAVASIYITTLKDTNQDQSADLPITVDWTGYTDEDRTDRVIITLNASEFLALYLSALVHKLTQLAIGKHNKQIVMNDCQHLFQLLDFIEANNINIQLYNIEEFEE